MLDFKFKTIHLVFTFIGCEQGKAIVGEYDKKSLYSMLQVNVINICIFWLNLKRVLLSKRFKNIVVWISLH
jgi:hypothetical protein